MSSSLNINWVIKRIDISNKWQYNNAILTHRSPLMAYPKIITDYFGTDLIKLLGPKNKRVPWKSLTFAEQAERIKNIPVYISTRRLGKAPSFPEMLFECFRVLQNLGDKNPLLGIDLPDYGSLSNASNTHGTPALNYFNTLTNVSGLYKNAEKQRDLFLQHILVDIVFQFEPGLVFPGVGRQDSKGRIFVNDAQHRTLACMFLGIDAVPLNYIQSDDEYWDVQQYAAININSLQCSEFDKYRIRVQRGDCSVEAGLPVDLEDQVCMDMRDVFVRNDITVTEKGDKEVGINGKVLTGIGNMIKYWKDYGAEITTRAIDLNALMFPTTVFQTANTWGLCEFLKAQDPNVDKMQMDYAIQRAIKTLLPKDNQGNKLHDMIKKKCKEDNNLSSIRFEPVVIAEGIRQICKVMGDEVEWTWNEPKWTEEKYRFELDLA